MFLAPDNAELFPLNCSMATYFPTYSLLQFPSHKAFLSHLITNEPKNKEKIIESETMKIITIRKSSTFISLQGISTILAVSRMPLAAASNVWRSLDVRLRSPSFSLSPTIMNSTVTVAGTV